MRRLLFSIDRLEYAGNRTVLVAGRNCGDAMKVGDVVNAMVCRSRFGRENQVLETEPIWLTMPTFHVFSRELDTLDAGYTAGIFIRAEKGTGLRLGWYLFGNNP